MKNQKVPAAVTKEADVEGVHSSGVSHSLDVFQCDLGRLAGLFKGQRHFDKSHSEAAWRGPVLSSPQHTTRHNTPLFTCLCRVFLSERGGWCKFGWHYNTVEPKLLTGIWSLTQKHKSLTDQINGSNKYLLLGRSQINTIWINLTKLLPALKNGSFCLLAEVSTGLFQH